MDSIKEYLEEQASRINTPDFIVDDPVQFPRRYTTLQDIEIVAFLISTIAWGSRKMILNSAEKLLSKFGGSPYDYVMNEGYKTLGRANVHRTFFEQDLAYMLRGFKQIFQTYGSIEAFAKALHIHKAEAPAWVLCWALRSEIKNANDRNHNTKCFPGYFETSALKRLNLALRWLVRSDGIVDLGAWSLLKPSQLYIPLDVHVGNTARELGLLKRKTNDRKAVEELTALLREFSPEDPIKYDFALFGIGINRKINSYHG